MVSLLLFIQLGFPKFDFSHLPNQIKRKKISQLLPDIRDVSVDIEGCCRWISGDFSFSSPNFQVSQFFIELVKFARDFTRVFHPPLISIYFKKIQVGEIWQFGQNRRGAPKPMRPFARDKAFFLVALWDKTGLLFETSCDEAFLRVPTFSPKRKPC